jgi:hypothetical protein
VNAAFRDRVQLPSDLGFLESGGRGRRRVFIRAGVKEVVDLQNENGDVTLYQVRQGSHSRIFSLKSFEESMITPRKRA